MFGDPKLTLVLVLLIILVLFWKSEPLKMPDDPDCPVGYYVAGGNNQFHVCTSGALNGLI